MYTMSKKKHKAVALAGKIKFNNISTTPNFQEISPEDFQESLQQIIENPHLIKQKGEPVCGVSVALKIAAEIDPITLVKMATHLYVNGNYNAGSFMLRAIKSPKEASKLQEEKNLSAVQVLHSSIKHTLNPITGYNPNGEGLWHDITGITFPHQIKRFLKDYFRIEFMNNTPFNNGYDKIKKHISRGDRVMALTNWGKMQHPEGKSTWFNWHYVLVKGIDKVDGKIKLFIDDSSSSNNLSTYTFKTEKQLKKAVRGIFCFNEVGTKERFIMEEVGL